MDIPFIYDRYVTNKDFAGRKSECLALSSLIAADENIVLSEPPKSGKKSLVQQTMFEMRIAGKNFCAAAVDMFNIRSSEMFLTKLGNAVIRSMAASPDEYEKAVREHLGGTCFTFDRQLFADYDKVISLTGIPDGNDMDAMFSLPYRMAEASGIKMIVTIDEFQSVLHMKDCDTVLKVMENVFRRYSEIRPSLCSYILSGSHVNAMKEIFCHRKFFWRTVEHLPLSRIDDRDLAEHIRRGFLKGGKDIERDQAIGICSLFKGNIWYINHFCAICDSMSKGYINEGIMLDALNILTGIHEVRFMDMMDSLTGHQISFLKAALDGETKFSSSDTIARYGLNSSANVRRVKDALLKKEILTFNEKEEPVILDPLFEYWVRKYYFEET